MVTNLRILNAFLIDEVTQENYFSKLLDLFTNGLLQMRLTVLNKKSFTSQQESF